MLGYIFPDGILHSSETASTHYTYIKELGIKINNYQDLVKKDGYIRVNDGSHWYIECLAELPAEEINDDQYQTLTDWLYTLMRYRNQIEIEIGSKAYYPAYNNDKLRDKYIAFWKIYSFDEYFPEDIIKEIKKYYNEQRYKNKESNV